MSLVPISTRPYHTKKMQTDWRLVEFIKRMRPEYGNVRSGIIKPFLDEIVSRSTIEKIIRRRRFTFEKRVKHKRKTKYSKLRIRKSPQIKKLGYIQMDSITLYVKNPGINKNIFNSCLIPAAPLTSSKPNRVG